MIETNHLQTPNHRKRVASGIVYLSILLLGGAGGFALMSSIQPPAPKSDLKAYHICLISSPTPITDFQPQIQAMERGVCDKATQPDRWTIFSNHQITSSATALPHMRMSYPRCSIFPPFYECEMKLTKVKGSDESRFKLLFSIGDATITLNSMSTMPVASSVHYFTIYDEQTRIIQLDSGEGPNRKYLYAMIMAHQVPLTAVKNFDLNKSRSRLRGGKIFVELGHR